MIIMLAREIYVVINVGVSRVSLQQDICDMFSLLYQSMDQWFLCAFSVYVSIMTCKWM